jgi:hypothetical protein
VTNSRVERASRLVAEEKFDEAINFLLDCCDAEEALSAASGQGVAPWSYESLAKVFRMLKLHNEEVSILERYERQIKAPGAAPALHTAMKREKSVKWRRALRRWLAYEILTIIDWVGSCISNQKRCSGPMAEQLAVQTNNFFRSPDQFFSYFLGPAPGQ